VRNLGADVPLPWTFTPTLTLGGEDEGPQSFFQIGPASVTTDPAGNIYILDRGNHRIVIFDDAGNHLRTLGRQGGGPGEFQMYPNTITVAADGSINVLDMGKQGLVRFAADGSVLPTRRVEATFPRGYAFMGEKLLLHTDAFGADAENPHERITSMGAEGDTATIVAFPVPPSRPVDFGCVKIGGMPLIFAPSIAWTTADSRLLVSFGADYAIDLYDGGRRTSSIRRNLPPRPATRELAMREAGDDFKITFGSGGECKVPAEKVVSEQGFAEFLPAIKRIKTAPDGTFWVQRFAVKGENAPVDLFSPDGEYLGTLAAGAPFPAAFLPDGRVAAIEKDELDVERVVVYRVGRGEAHAPALPAR
jgi:hypothetical protein